MSLVRLDKFLADMQIGTRSEVKKKIHSGSVKVDGYVVKKPEMKVDIIKNRITVEEIPITYCEKEYYMLNKPQGVVSATIDSNYQTVVDLIKDRRRKDLFPVGRLDIDTEGLILITNDGKLCHNLLSPDKHVAKRYYAIVKGVVNEEDVKVFANGMDIGINGQNEPVKPAQLTILPVIDKEELLNGFQENIGEEFSQVELTIYEGKFHQVKRMFDKVRKPVIYLKRISMGPLALDEKLAVGEYRMLTEEEIHILKEYK